MLAMQKAVTMTNYIHYFSSVLHEGGVQQSLWQVWQTPFHELPSSSKLLPLPTRVTLLQNEFQVD